MTFFSLIRRLAGVAQRPLSAKHRGKVRRPRLEALEGRDVPANVSIDPNTGQGRVQFVDANNLPIVAPVYGQEVRLKVAYTTVDMPVTTPPWVVAVSIDGQTLTFAGATGTGRHTAFLEGWYAGPGAHTIEVEVDPFHQVAETNEQTSDNITSFDYAPIAPTNNPILAVPVTGQRGADWTIGSYTDVNASGAADDPFGGNIAFAGHQGLDFAQLGRAAGRGS